MSIMESAPESDSNGSRKRPQESDLFLQAIDGQFTILEASFLKHKIDHKECLALAKKYLKFVCNEEQAEPVYLKLRTLMKFFSRTSSFENNSGTNPSQSCLSASKKIDTAQQLHGEESSSLQLDHPELGEISDCPRSSENIILEQQQDSLPQSPSTVQQNLGSLKDVLLRKRVDLINKICSKRAEDLILKQQVELSDFNMHREEVKMKMKSAHDSDLDHVRSHIDCTIRNNNIELLNQVFSKKMTEYNQHIRSQHSKLAAMQEDARDKEDVIRHHWLGEAKAGSLTESFDNLPLTESGFRLEEFTIVSSQIEACDCVGDMIASRPGSDQVCSGMTKTGHGECNALTIEHLKTPPVLPSEGEDDIPVETDIAACQTNNMVRLDSAQPTGASISRFASDHICDGIITAGPGEYCVPSANLLKIPSDIPSERLEDLPVEIENIVYQADNSFEVEGVEPTGTLKLVSTAFPQQTIGRMSMETDTTPSLSYNVSMEGSVIDNVLDSTTRTPAITVDGDLEEGCDNSDNTHFISYQPQIQAEVQSDTIVAVSSVPEPMLIDSTETTTMLASKSVDSDPHEAETNCDVSCLNSLLRENQDQFAPSFPTSASYSLLRENQDQFAPSFPTSSSSACEVLVTPNLISICELETPAVFVTAGPDQDVSSSQQIIIPASDPIYGVPSQVNQTNHNTSSLISRCEVPASVDITLTENGRRSTRVQLEHETEPYTQVTNMSDLQTEVLMQQPISHAVSHGDRTTGVLPVPRNSSMQLDTTRPGHLGGTDGQSLPGSQSSQMPPWTAPQALGPDSLQNELMRIRKQDELRTKMHEDKKLKLELERDQEIERIRWKYEVLLQDAETGFVHDKKMFETLYNKVLLNRILAEEFRTKFMEHKGATTSLLGPRPPPVHQFLQASHAPRVPRQPAPIPFLAPNSINLPSLQTQVPTPTPFLRANSVNLPSFQTQVRTPSIRPPVGPRATSFVHSGPMARHTPPLFPTNQVRPHFSPVLPPRMNHQPETEARARAPAPHLLRFRPPLSTGQFLNPHRPLPNLVSATMAPRSGTYHQPVVPASSPVTYSVTLSTRPLSRYGNPNVGGCMPNLGPKGNETAPSSSVAAAEHVCISDEE